MVFTVFWTVLLGVVGGVFSSAIVSRVFLIQSEYQEQLNFVDRIARKISFITAFLQATKAVFEVSYDEDIRMEREMKEKGYQTDMEYYAAHNDKKWISKSDVLASFRKEITKTANSINYEISENPVEDEQLNALLRDMMTHAHEVSSTKELSFSNIESFMKNEQALMGRYDNYIHMSGKVILKLILKDRVMVMLFWIFVILVSGTIITGLLGV